ncbi:hypothetical protein [Streptomyces sp. CA-111067]|uniref:hypothetical protein n=1 Tax=Streptomyces sp. CA-111067 TaxID=3240046 RepID=UPI003D99D21B
MRSNRHSPLTYAAVIAASPVLLIAGDPLAQAALRRMRKKATTRTADGGFSTVRLGRPGAFDAHAFFFNPLAIALAAPSRWVGDRLRR